jgi:hypothetical protein
MPSMDGDAAHASHAPVAPSSPVLLSGHEPLYREYVFLYIKGLEYCTLDHLTVSHEMRRRFKKSPGQLAGLLFGYFVKLELTYIASITNDFFIAATMEKVRWRDWSTRRIHVPVLQHPVHHHRQRWLGVPTKTRPGFTIRKVVNVDLEIDLEAPTHIDWVAGVFEETEHKRMLAMEATMVETIRSAEKIRKALEREGRL